jgi:ELWxxDGT repeat protein
VARAHQRTAARHFAFQHVRHAIEPLERRVLLAAHMVCDIDPLPGASSYPGEFTDVNGTIFFSSSTTDFGRELWRTDGTEAGTLLVKDIELGASDSYPGWFTDLNGAMIFVADDNTYGQELWRSDGTEAGTALVTEIFPGLHYFSLNPRLTSFNGLIYFTASNGTNGEELWKTDGTAAGTMMVKDIRPGSASGIDSEYSDSYLINVNGTLFFTAADGSHGVELWKSDGTAEGTVMVKDIYPGASGSSPVTLTNVNGTLFFSATDGITGHDALWKSDGTNAGTVLVKDMAPGAGGGPSELTDAGGTLFFAFDGGTTGTELWKSDGTAEGTVLVRDIQPGVVGSRPEHLTNVNGTLLFSADDGWLNHGRELWKSDGTDAGTLLVRDIKPGTESAIGSWIDAELINVDRTLYFSANDGAGIMLWQSDGTLAGTERVPCVGPGCWLPTSLTNVNGALFFAANDGVHGKELWRVAPPAFTWDGGGDGVSWSDPLNWSQDRLPGADDHVVISVPTSPNILINTSPTIRSLTSNENLALTSGGALVLRAGSLQLGAAARLDLADNVLVIDYTGISPIDSIRGYLTSGYAAGVWNGSGINSSVAALTANYAVGYAESSVLTTIPPIFGTVDDTAVLVRCTRYGDADLNQTVSLSDFNRLASAFGQTSTVWTCGNFNYDSATNLADFNLLAGNFGQSLAPWMGLARGLFDQSVDDVEPEGETDLVELP